MPFDEENPKEFVPKVGLKKVSGQQSMFDGKPKPPTQEEFRQQVQSVQDTKTGYNKRAAELFMKFSKTMSDKTLPQNRNIFNNEAERELQLDMVNLAKDINADQNEPEGEGSLTIIICLIKACLAQRDRLNELEYALQKKIDAPGITDLIKKEIAAALDAKKSND